MRLLAAAAALGSASAIDWTKAIDVLNYAIGNRTFPGCAAGVLAPDGSLILNVTLGSQVYPGESAPLGDGNPPTNASSLWDMASLTKIMGATSASALLYEGGYLDLDMLVSDPSLLGPAYAAQGKGAIKIRDLMMHQAGYPPDPEPGYSTADFGCPSSTAPQPNLTFSCSERIFAALLNQSLEYPTGTKWVYSDLSMITMQYVIGVIVSANGLVGRSDLRPDCAGADAKRQRGLYLSCHFEAYVRVHIHAFAGLDSTHFLLPAASWPLAMPTYDDPSWRHAIMQGQVSDENSYALGGIAGHAGIFTTLGDALTFLGMWAYGPLGGYPAVITESTRKLFTTAPDPAFSPRALGWVTQAATDTYQGCGAMSPLTWYHTGFTGTLMCADPTTGVSLVLLTTRVYPNATANTVQIQAARQAFATAVVEAVKAAGV